MAFAKLCICLAFFYLVRAEELADEKEFTIDLSNPKVLQLFGKDIQKLRSILDDVDRKRPQVAYLNEYVDDVLDNLNIWLNATGNDPISLPGFEESFRWTVFKGWIALDKGWLRGLSTLKRIGDSTVQYKYPYLQTHISLSFTNLTFDYHYEAKFMGLGPGGTVNGNVTDSIFTVDLSLNMVRIRTKLNKFKLNSLGDVSIRFDFGVVGDMANILIEVITPLVKPIIRMVLENYLTDGLNYFIDYGNNVVCTFLDDCI